jgi:hypothetical protein
MQAACDIAFEYAHLRNAFGQPIGKFQVNTIKNLFLVLEFSKFLFSYFVYLSYCKEKWPICTQLSTQADHICTL